MNKAPALKRIFKALFISLQFFILIVFISPLFSPERYPLLGLLSLFVPIAIGVTIIALCITIIFSLKRTVLMIPALICSIFYFLEVFSFNQGAAETDEATYTLLNYNLNFFNYTLTSKADQKNVQVNLKAAELSNWIINTSCEILCFQEFYYDESNPILNTSNMLIIKGYDYAISRRKRGNLILNYGVATFSKFPIIESTEFLFGGETQNRGLITDVVINTDTVRIINVHLSSLGINDKTIISNPVQTLKLLIYSFSKLDSEVNIVLRKVEASPYPVILTGDFNLLPYTYHFYKISDLLIDSFSNKGNGFGFTTYILGFGLRVDHIFTSSNIEVENVTVLSDVNFNKNRPTLMKIKKN